MPEGYQPGKALAKLVFAAANWRDPSLSRLGKRDLLVGAGEGAFVATGITAIAGCGDNTPTMPTCEDPLALGPVDCRTIGDINNEVDAQYPGLRSALSESVQPFATVMGVDSIEVYFHTFDANLPEPNDFNAQPQVFAGNVSLHIWVENVKSIPPKDELIIVTRHEGAHALDAVLARKKTQGTDSFSTTISPEIPLGMFDVSRDQYGGYIGKTMKPSVVHILKEGEYVDTTVCPPVWCFQEKKGGHPGDNNMEGFASSFNVMLNYPEEFMKRLQELALTDGPTAKIVAHYCLSVLNLVTQYGGTDAIQTLRFNQNIIPTLTSVANQN